MLATRLGAAAVDVLSEGDAGVMVGVIEGELVRTPLSEGTESARGGRIRRMLADHRIGLVCHLPTFVSTADLTDSIREASIEEVLGSLDTAAELGAE